MASEREQAYGAAGRAAGEAVLEFGRDGARLRPANDAFLLSRIARACVEAALPHLRDEFVREVAERMDLLAITAPKEQTWESIYKQLRRELERFGEAPATREERDRGEG